MSIEKVRRKRKAHVWRVRWRDDADRKQSKTFDRKNDAEAFEAKVKLAKRRGDLEDLTAGEQRLDAFVKEWKRLYAEPQLAPKTRSMYDALLDRYILPRLGKQELRRLKPGVIQRFSSELTSEGVGQETVRKSLALLQGILQRSVEWGRIRVNPAKAVKKPPSGRKRAVRPLAPAAVEKIRSKMHPRDATLVSVLAYAGLRPGEALALTWGDVQGQTIIVDKAVSAGQLKETKTRQTRSVRLLAPLASDLAEWKMRCGRPSNEALVFPRRDGRAWMDSDWNNWRKRVFAPAAKALGGAKLRPYDLRHSFVSLLLAERASVVEVAQQAGHSPTMALDTYGHVIDELRGQDSVSAEAVIRKARDSRVPQKAPKAGKAV